MFLMSMCKVAGIVVWVCVDVCVGGGFVSRRGARGGFGVQIVGRRVMDI